MEASLLPLGFKSNSCESRVGYLHHVICFVVAVTSAASFISYDCIELTELFFIILDVEESIVILVEEVEGRIKQGLT